MFRAFLMTAVAMFATAMFAQVTPTPYTVSQVVHEPTKAQVGPAIAVLPADIPPPPAYPMAPMPPAGTAPNNCYGNGNGFKDLDRVTREFFAIAGSTTHDLAYIRNGSASDIIIDTTTIGFSTTPANDVPAKPEATSPGALNTFIHGYAASVNVPAGAEIAVFLIVTRWNVTLDTSPRDYIVRVTFMDTSSGTPVPREASGMLTVPKGDSDSGGCVSSSDRSPAGAILLALGGMAAILPRVRRALKRVKA